MCLPLGWLEPLLQLIAINRTTVAIPVMDIIDDTTFQYKAFDGKSINIGGFDWNLQFNWISIPEREKQRQSSVIVPVRYDNCCLYDTTRFVRCRTETDFVDMLFNYSIN